MAVDSGWSVVGLLVLLLAKIHPVRLGCPPAYPISPLKGGELDYGWHIGWVGYELTWIPVGCFYVHMCARYRSIRPWNTVQKTGITR